MITNNSTDESLILKHVITIYNSPDHVYAQLHRVALKENVPELLEARPMTHDGLYKLCSMMMPRLAPEIDFLPPRIIARGGPKSGPIVWWRPSHQGTIFFSKNTGMKSGKVSFPSLLFARTNGKLYVYALKGKVRPDESTTLYAAPFYNVDNSGNVCLGNLSVRKDARINQWEDAFFNSQFTLEEGHKPVKRVKSGTIGGLWKKQVGHNVSFPSNVLVPNQKPKNVDDLIRVIKRREFN